MKKIFSVLLLSLMLTGCGKTQLLNTPTKKTEMFLSKYQSLDADVLEQLNDITEDKTSFTEKQKEDYIELMKKHYQALKYEIKDDELKLYDTIRVSINDDPFEILEKIIPTTCFGSIGYLPRPNEKIIVIIISTNNPIIINLFFLLFGNF